MTQSDNAALERFDFRAEVSQVLGLVINSLYSNKEIFLRELLSNASDALDKLKYRMLTEHDLVESGHALEIRVWADTEAGTLTIEDSGVGMTREELIENLGTVAHSGTRGFLQAVKAQQEANAAEDVNLIGQFGVGFYSAYLVADRVEVTTRGAGSDAAWRWASDAATGFSVEPAEREGVGTAVTLHLKEDQKEFLQEWRLSGLITRYSDFVTHPIKLRRTRTEGEGDERKEVQTFEQVNKGRALWLRNKSEVEDEEYVEFYKHISHDWDAPLAWTHFKVEGMREFAGILYLPAKAPFDLYSTQAKRGVRLYAKRVFIMDDAEELVPQWLRFVRGVVDSNDLDLNVSREILQDSTTARSIKKQLVKKTLDRLDELAEESPEDYAKFWETFGPVLKEGLHFAFEYKGRLASLVRYKTSTGSGWTSLAEYVDRMPEGQEAIYYALGPSEQAVAKSPHLEALSAKGYEVLYMTDAIDEFAVANLDEFDGKKLQSAMKADLSLDKDEDEDAQKAREAKSDALGGLVERIKETLGDAVGEVRVSNRLTSSPACLVVPEGAMHAHVERLLRVNNPDAVPQTKRIFEINPDHALIQSMRKLHEADAGSETVSEWIQVLHGQALLTEGSPLTDPNAFAESVTRLLTAAASSAAE